ncbi:MAG TPA: exosortase/archaeosortase family protein [Rariglobus sp.]|jgi:exosortase|nr:exosortase/archaeosortase family protein [Rariglobus sp.]
MSTSGPSPVTRSDRLATGCVLVSAGLLIAALSALLWPQWLHNPDLSHGLFVPAIFFLLLHESRKHGPWRWLPETPSIKILRASAIVAGLALVALGGLFAAAVDWSHALVGQMLACALSMLLFAALVWMAGDRMKLIPLNWSSLVAVGLWPLSAPIPPGTYQHITLTLQLWVTKVVIHSLHLLGIPATTAGNIIELAHTSVGVEEACSGVRSLVSCIVAGLFFSATLVRRPAARVFIVVLSVPLAIGMNILRSLLLTLFANAGIDIGGTWHDLTGFAVLGVTSLILGGLALWLGDRPASPPPPEKTGGIAGSPSRRWGVPAGLMAALLLAAFFVFNTHGTSRPGAAAPDLEAILPAAAEGWNVITAHDLYQFTATLQTDHLVQRSYVRTDSDNKVEHVTFYLAYWPPGQAPVSLVSSHTPDACWPGTGWEALPRTPGPTPFLVGDQPVPAPEARVFKNGPIFTNVWYWHLYDGHPIVQIDPRSPRALLKLALRYGFHKDGDQLFIRISSNRPWEELRDDPLIVGILSRLHPLGL